MYFELTPEVSPEQEHIRETVRAFANDVIRPAARILDKLPAEEVPNHPAFRDTLRQAWQMQLHTVLIPEIFGGMGLDPLATHIVLEEMGRGSASFAISIAVASFPAVGAVLLATENESLIGQFVVPFCKDGNADLIGCWAITEPDHGSDWLLYDGLDDVPPEKVAASLRAKKIDGRWVLNGQKAAWVSNGPVATHAYCFVGIDPSLGMRGSGIALVDLRTHGVSRGKPWDKMGQRALPQGEIYFDNVEVPEENMIVADPELYPFAIDSTLATANSAMGAMFTGVAQAAFDEALAYCKERVQGGKPLIEHTEVQSQLAAMFRLVETARAISRRVMEYNYQTVTPSLKHAIVSKTFCTDAACKVAEMAIQLCGGMGLGKESDIEMIFRDAQMAVVEDGTNHSLSLSLGRMISQDGE